MSFWEERFIKALREELEKRSYMFLEVKSKPGSSSALYKFLYLIENQPRIIKVFELPVINKLDNKYLEVLKKLSNFQDDKIIKVLGSGYLVIDNENYFFGIFEYIEGKALDDITPTVFWEKHRYMERIDLFNQTLNAISVFRNRYELHNDLHIGNIMLTRETEIKIIDFSSSDDSYNGTGADYDLYLIKNNLMDFFMKPEEIASIKEKLADFSSIDFAEFHEIIKHELPRTEIEHDTDELKCFRAIDNIINFYFTHFDEQSNRPVQYIEKERRTDILDDVQKLNMLKKTAESLDIRISGDWDPLTHGRGINHEIFITVTPDLIIRIIQHEFGEAMRISIKQNNELVVNREQVESNLDVLRELASKEVVVSRHIIKETVGSLSLEDIEDVLVNSKPDEWQYRDDYGIYIFKPNVELNIRIRDKERESVKDDYDKFEEDWVEEFSDKNARKVIARVFFRGSFVTEYIFISVDGGRMLLPLPKAYKDLRITPFQYKLGKILNSWGIRLRHYDIYVFTIAKFTIYQNK